MTASNPYDGLKPCPFCGSEPKLLSYRFSEDFLAWFVECQCGARLNPHSPCRSEPDRQAATESWNNRCDSEALSLLTRDVEEAREALAKIAYAVSPLNSDDRETLRRNSKVAENIARAALTRLSRPTDLGADPAFVASQSSPSVSTKGFNRGERKDAK